jgi:hypothetical protein
MGGRADFVDLEDGRLITIALGGFPGTSGEDHDPYRALDFATWIAATDR